MVVISVAGVGVPPAHVQLVRLSFLRCGSVAAVHQIAIQRKGDERRVGSAAAVVGLAIQALGSEWVAVVVVVRALASVRIAPIHLAAHEGKQAAIVVVGEDGHTIDSHGRCAGLGHASHSVQWVRHGIRGSAGQLLRCQRHFEDQQLLSSRSSPAIGTPSWRQWDATQVAVRISVIGWLSVRHNHKEILGAPCGLHVAVCLQLRGQSCANLGTGGLRASGPAAQTLDGSGEVN
mmetsp:Transcript_92197/g.166506  ORF Transcript_92197/g.166506 Transcript_92197/m.166506 type:complete len:233 (+) Transcript_92197:1694-2392(+)